MKKIKLLFAAVALLCSAGSWAQKDVTSQYITNATLSSLNGWTNTNFNNPVQGNNTTGYASECYAGWGSLEKTQYSLTQKITLPAGNYTLVNYSFFRYGLNADTDPSKSLAYLKAGNNQVAIKTLGSITAAGYSNSQAEGANAFDSKMYRNTLDFTIAADNTEIEIGLFGTFDLKQSWIIAGMFELIANDIPATMDAPFDVTGYLTNSGFEYRDMSGWTLSEVGAFGTQNNSQSFKVGGYYAEKWQQSGALSARSMSQTLTGLPAGYYKLTANLGGDGTYIDLNGKSVNWTADGNYTTGYVLAENEDLTVTAGKTAEGTANWIHFDNFKLQFCGDVAAALTTLLGQVTEYESKLPAADYSELQAAVAVYNKNYSDVDELLAAIAAVQALYDKADQYVLFCASLAAAQDVDQEAKMNAGVLSALNTAISDAESISLSSEIAAINTAKNSLTTAVANAETSIANYVEALAIINAADTYDEVGQESYRNSDVISGLYTDYNLNQLVAVSDDQRAAAKVALVAACKAQIQPTDGCDMTAFIDNPGIDGNVNGWTCIINDNGGYAGGPLKPSNDAMEFWGASTLDEAAAGKSFDYYQELSGLPNGAYTISADMLNSTNSEEGASWNGGGKAGLYGKTAADEVKILVTTDGETFLPYTTDVIFVIDGELRIGVKNIAALTGRWFACDNFKLTYARQLTDEEKETIAKENAIAVYNEALAEAQAIEEGTIPSGAYTTLQNIITENTLADGTSTEYNTAATALSEAATAATPLVAPYAAYIVMKANVQAFTKVEGYKDIKSGATTTLTNAISDADDAVEAATAAATITEQTAAVKAAGLTFLTGVRSDGEHPFNITFLIVNPGFDNNNIEGWKRQYNGGSADTSHHNNEFYNNDSFDFYQTLSDMPKGNYELKVQAFQRPGDAEVVYNAYLAGNTSTDAVVYINDGETPVKHIAVEAQNAPIFGEAGAGWPADSQVGSEGSYKYIPNSMEGAEQWFNAGHYDNSIFTAVDGGELKLGFKADHKTADKTWTLFDNFRLYFYGQSIKVAMSETEAFAALADIEGADVTMTRTSKVGFNTVALPFDLTADQVEDVFGEGAVVYEFSDVDENTISFDSKAQQTIEANEPVLVKATAAATQIVANNVIVKTGDAKVEGTYFDFVGNYGGQIALAEGLWFVGNNAVYKSEGNTNMKGFRAYIQAKEGTPSDVKMYIDGIETRISEVNGNAVENGAIYNLAGQRVGNAQKGIYIVNGKKVIIK